MKTGRLLLVAMLFAGFLAGLASHDEKPIATSGTQIKVFRVEKGYELEVSWSGGQPGDIAILGVAAPWVNQLQRAWPVDPIREGQTLAWHAGESGTIRIPVVPNETDEDRELDLGSKTGWSAGLMFVAKKMTIPINARTSELPTKGKPFAGTGEWKRDIVFTAEEIGTQPCRFVVKGSEPRESIFLNVKIQEFECDLKTELPLSKFGPGIVSYPGADPMWNPRQANISIMW